MFRRGPLFVFLAATLWGTTGTAQALGPDGITPITVAFIRMLGGSLLVGFALRVGSVSPLRSLPRLPLAVAIAAMASSQPIFFAAVERTGVAVGTIVAIGSGPLLAGALGWLVRREAVSPRWYLATALSVPGTILLASGGESAGVDTIGLLLAIGAGMVWAVYLVGAKAVFDAVDPVFAAGVVFAGAAVVLAPFALVSGMTWVGGGRGVLVALWLAPIATGVSYVFFSRGLQSTGVAVAATMTLAEPLTATVLGLIVLSEPMRLTTVFGILLILIGLGVLIRKP